MSRTTARVAAGAALATAALAIGAAPASAATVTRDKGHGAGFNVLWIDHTTTPAGRGAGLTGNFHVGFLQTFKNQDKPLFVDGTIQDFTCATGQNPVRGECTSLASHQITAGDARLEVGTRLANARLTGTIRIGEQEGGSRPVPIDLAVRKGGDLQDYHYLDDVVDPEYTLRYEATGVQRGARAHGRVAGSRVDSSEATFLRFSWSIYRKVI